MNRPLQPDVLKEKLSGNKWLDLDPLGKKNWDIIVNFLERNSNEEKSEKVFKPDEWTVAILTAILKILSEKYNEKKGEKVSILEVGVWTGRNLKFLLENYKQKIKKLFWTDLIEEAIIDSEKCIKELNEDGKCELILSNLLKDVPKKILDILDFMYACIPQVMLPEGSKRPEDYYAHYYDKEEFKAFIYNKFGFWLLEKYISQSSVNAPWVDIVMNVSWRINKSIINSMFNSYWYTAEYVYDKIIPQCAETELWMYVELENENRSSVWEFYEDAEGRIIISAELAEKRRKDNMPVYHRIYVVKGVPKSKLRNKT